MSHTPGPWHVEREDAVEYIIDSSGDPSEDVICRVHPRKVPDERLANARLISAAPDLLAACEELLLVAGTYKPIDMYDWERVSAVIDQAKAVVKKARGEE